MTTQMPEFFDLVRGEPLLLDASKVGWWPERIAAWKRGERIAPVVMDVAWTRKCNYACEFCYASMQSSEGGKEITREIALSFLEDAADIGVRAISLISDGESSIVPFYAESIETASQLGLRIGIGTNGKVLRRPMLERILPHLTYLRFNFSAGTREGYVRIMGARPEWYDQVIENIRSAMSIKRERGLSVTVNMQLVCDPKNAQEILPFARLALELAPDYAIIKHCADNFDHDLGVQYSRYREIEPLLREAEALSTPDTLIKVKWNRIANEGKREYRRCYGPPFVLQMSGNGLIAPCGFLFNERYKAFHIGNICEKRFRDIFFSERYLEVMHYLAEEFDPSVRCGPNCLQHPTNDFLWKHVHEGLALPSAEAPRHKEFL